MRILSLSNRGTDWRLRRKILLSLCTALLMTGCASTGNNFDETKVSQIKKGETTEAQLVQLFGSPESRSIGSENGTILVWTYAQSTMKGESFIPYAGPFMGGSRSKVKSLMVTLENDKVTNFTYTGAGDESRGTTQGVPKN